MTTEFEKVSGLRTHIWKLSLFMWCLESGGQRRQPRELVQMEERTKDLALRQSNVERSGALKGDQE